MSSPLKKIAVVGASLAGLRAGESLRAEGFDGDLTIVGAEPHLPYNRPPLSKELLAGKVDRATLDFSVADVLDAHWRLGVAATGLDLTRRRVRLADDSQLEFDGLIIATGGRPRPLSAAADLPRQGVFMLRTIDDSLRLRAALEAAQRVAVIGAGFIGCEVASTARSLGREVVLIDVATAPMEAHLGPAVGRWAAALQEAQGVRLQLGRAVEKLEGIDSLNAVRLTDGTRIEADLAVIGLGTVPNTEWLKGSGVPLENGVVCDGALRVEGVDNVVAAGDLARWPYAGGPPLRVEHWSNAVEQGMAAARTLLHGAHIAGPFHTLPSFWSDQHGVRIQSIGLPALGTQGILAEGSFDEDRFIVLYARCQRVVGALSAGLPPRRLARMRRAVIEGEPVTDVLKRANS